MKDEAFVWKKISHSKFKRNLNQDLSQKQRLLRKECVKMWNLPLQEKREELRVEVEKQLESQHAESLAERKGRLREKFDLTFSQAVDEISRGLEFDLERELDERMQLEFETYRNAREADIQNRLARFRFERESELRDKMDETYSLKKQDWAERLELEFQSREEAARKAIMSEIDARLRNERLTHETDLELMKEETVLELELEMEERLGQFRSRKEEEVATQLESNWISARR